MRRYTLNDRGRAIFIQIPGIIAVAILTSTNAIDLFVTWICN